jgi:glutathionyl-hydroquinone reductase
VDMNHIRRHYYESLLALNPSGTVPDHTLPDYTATVDRGRDISRLLTF